MRTRPSTHLMTLAMLAWLLSTPAAFAHGVIARAHAQPGQPASTAAGTPSVLELPAPAGEPDLASGSVTFIGNATVLIRYAGFTVLTDPNFLHRGDHVHLGYGLKSRRLTEPALSLDNLPPIDLVVLSHLHGDHFDQLVQEKLDRAIPIVTTPAAAAGLAKMGFQSRYALPPWQAVVVKKGGAILRISAMPARHGPPVLASLLPETMGSMLEFGASENSIDYRMYISGDTLVFDEIKNIAQRYPDIDLGLLHLGGTKILNMVTVTMDAKAGVEMMRIVAPRKAIPIHYNDYDVFTSPIEDFLRHTKAAEMQHRIIYLKHGETYTFKRESSPAPAR